MSTPVASYSFLSWARQGLGIHTVDALPGETRGRIGIDVTVTGQKIGGGEATDTFRKDLALYGPGDITGIEARAIVRTEPRHWITNFESNYLAFIEFYDEDFPWRYTPAAPTSGGRRLTPWLALAVLEEGEFAEGGTIVGRPLPSIQIPAAASKLPPAHQLWAWAHVHMNGTLGGADLGDRGALAQRLDSTVRADRDQACSRLLCPRALKPNTGYHAFLIPAFETGRLAGLGLNPGTAPSATRIAWEGGGAEADSFPVYHRWYFRTGAVGDFEYLVRLLEPRTANPKVGTRDFDVQDAGPGVRGVENPDVGGILRLGGALRVPRSTLDAEALEEFDRFDLWAADFPQPFQRRLAGFLNLPQDYLESGAGADPIIVPPIYGRWHAAVSRLLDGPTAPADRERWLNELNLDPRYRVAAGFGTRVIQKHQEDYMEAAWQQVGRVLAGNQKIRHSQIGLAVSIVWNMRHIEPLRAAQPERFLMLVAPAARIVAAGDLTLATRIEESIVPAAVLSKAMRQALRPRGRIARRIGFDPARNGATLIGRINRGEVAAVRPKAVPPGLPTGDSIADKLRPAGWPAGLAEALKRRPWLRWGLLLLALALGLLGLLLGLKLLLLLAGLGAIAGLGFAWAAGRLLVALRAADTLRSGGLSPAGVAALPQSPDFLIAEPGIGPAPTVGASDSEEAVRFKAALTEIGRLDAAEARIKVDIRRPLPLGELAAAAAAELRPQRTIPQRTLLHVQVPARIRERLVEEFGEVMVYPEIDQPMYEPLKALSPEMFLPNIQLLEQNSITLLETNQKFIEAYMVGLNHEFARELLWREFPTDQRGTCFQQFWDVRSFLAEPGVDREALRKRLRDIPPIHEWKSPDHLDDHDNRELQGDKEEELVLVIRGELLKKYPNAIIYAHRAAWERVGDAPGGAIDRARPRKLADLPPALEAKPPRDLVKTPIYEASIEPDIYFFGFDLTAETARGGRKPGTAEEDPGWFFVIKERPGEPRFGLDLPKAAPQTELKVWNDLAWSDVMFPVVPGASLAPGTREVRLLASTAADLEMQNQEDRRFRWHGETHSAELAYILYQVPVLMAVHAAEMLPDGR